MKLSKAVLKDRVRIRRTGTYLRLSNQEKDIYKKMQKNSFEALEGSEYLVSK